MDISHDNTPNSSPDSSADEGRSHFLETLGAGDEALNSLHQLREVTMQNRDDVVLSSQPDEVSRPVGDSAPASGTVQAQLFVGRGLTEPKGNADAVQFDTKPEVRVQNVSVNMKAVKIDPAPMSEIKPTDESVDFGINAGPSRSGEETAATERPLADLPLFLNVTAKTEPAPAVDFSAPSEVPVAAEVVSPEKAIEQISSEAPETEVSEEAEMVTADETEEVTAVETVVPEEADSEVSAEEQVSIVPADSAPRAQITLPCPKCQGELTLMREHLGIEGNCVWCQIPIVAAASGANGQVRIFPIQPETSVPGTSVSEAPESQTAEKIEEVTAELAAPAELEMDASPLEAEEPKTEGFSTVDEEVIPDEAIVTEAPASETEPEPVEASIKDLTELEIVSEFEKAANEGMSMTLDSSPETPSETSLSGPIASLSPIGSLPTGFQSSPPSPPLVEAPPEAVPSGFAPPESDLIDSFVNEEAPFQDHLKDQSSAPIELGPETAVPSELEDLPAPVSDEMAVPIGFSSMASPIELDDAPGSKEPALAPGPEEPALENEAVAAGFTTPEPWGAPTEPSLEVPVEESSSESVPSDFIAPAEPGSATSPDEIGNASEPWAALPPMPVSEVEAPLPDSVDNPESIPEPAGFVQRDGETEVAAMSAFASSVDLDDAPKDLPPFPAATDSSRGLSGFDVPIADQETSHFGQLEMSAPEAADMLPVPESDIEATSEEVSFLSAEALNTEPKREDETQKGFGISLMNITEEPPASSPFPNSSPFASLTNTEPAAVAEAPAESAPEEQELPSPVAESAPVNKIPEPEGPRVESKTLGSIEPKKKARKGFIVFMVILVGFVCGGALATFVLPIDEYVAVAKGYMETKFGVEAPASSDLLNLPSVINPLAEPVAPASN